jgi:hypothetical protein
VVFGNDVRRITHVIMCVSVNLITSVITHAITRTFTHVSGDAVKVMSDLRVRVTRN